MEAVFQDCIREVKAEGRTVLLSSHILAEVEALCDRVSIIRAGRTQQSGTLQELRGMTRTSITAEVARPADGLADLPGVHALEVDGARVRFDVDTEHLEARRAPARRARGAQPGEPPADARGAVPPPLRRRARARDGLAGPEATTSVTTTDAAFTGVGPLTRFALRRDRVRIAACGSPRSSCSWSSTVASVKGLYPNQAELDTAAAASEDNAAAIIFNGPPQGLDTVGGQVAFQTGTFGLDRDGADERLHARPADPGRGGGRPLGAAALAARSDRTRSPAAALITVAAMNVVAGALVTLALVALDLPVAGRSRSGSRSRCSG